jgi:chromate transporter
VLVLVVEALLRVSRRALKGRSAWGLAAAAFAALFLFNIPFPVVVLAAGVIGYVAPGHFTGSRHGKATQGPPALLDAVLDADPGRAGRMARSARNAGLLSVAAWLLPFFALLPKGGVFGDITWFFSKMAVVTFGGAYAVLAYVAQEAVGHYHWLSAPEMLTGLGLAETTPGPLILVLQFVGFLAGYRAPGLPHGIAGGLLASSLTLWVTFMPCFAFVFLGAPLLERLQSNHALTGALAAITAGVVGVIANLAIWFALHALFLSTVHIEVVLMSFDVPVLTSLDPWTLLLSVVAAIALLRVKLGVTATLAICAGTSIGLNLTFGIL